MSLFRNLRGKPLVSAGLIVSAVLVTILVSWLDLNEVWAAIEKAKPLPLVLSGLLYCCLFPLRGLRWSMLLRPLVKDSPASAKLSPKTLFVRSTESFLIGFAANNVFPARLGDVLRALVMARRTGLSQLANLSTVLLEKIFDGLTVVLILAVALSEIDLGVSSFRNLSVLTGLAFGGAFFLCLLLARFEAFTLRVFETALADRFPYSDSILHAIKKLRDGLQSLRSLRQASGIAALSAMIWWLEEVVYVGVMDALGLKLPFLGLAAVMAVLTLGLSAPSAPGFVGVFEMLIIPTLGLLGVASSEAAAFALLLHLIHFLPGTLLGLGLSARLGLQPAALKLQAEPES